MARSARSFQGGIKAFLTKRVLSFGMILGVVFLMIASLVVTTALSVVGTWMGGHLSHALSTGVAEVLSFIVSFVVITSLFALIFKFLPDGRVQWRDAWVGGALTSILFTIGKTALGLYLGKAAPGSAYGAAGSLVVIVLWLYYASLIVLFGARVTEDLGGGSSPGDQARGGRGASRHRAAPDGLGAATLARAIAVKDSGTFPGG